MCQSPFSRKLILQGSSTNSKKSVLQTAREAMRLAANKLPVKTKFVVRESEIGGDNDEDK